MTRLRAYLANTPPWSMQVNLSTQTTPTFLSCLTFSFRFALVQFCEDNYLWTPCVAELANSVSNLAYVAVGYHGISQARLAGLPLRVQVCYGALIVLGIGSTLFHGTSNSQRGRFPH